MTPLSVLDYVSALVGLVLCGFVVRGCVEAFRRDVLGWWRTRRRLTQLRRAEQRRVRQSNLNGTTPKPTRRVG
jgi:hypothetical protein